MENISSFALIDICRSCLSAEGVLVSMESDMIDSLKIRNCLKVHLNLDIDADDGLPQNICMNCLDTLMNIRRFHLRFLESEGYLLQQYADWFKITHPDALATPAYEEGKSTKIGTCSYDDATAVRINIGDETLVLESRINNEPIISTYIAGDMFLQEAYEYISYEELQSHTDGGPTDSINDCSEDKTKTTFDITSAEANESIKSKTSQKPISCLQCNEKFDNRNTLRSHFHSVHGEDNARGFCMKCSTVFPSRGTLMTHLYEHTLSKSRLKCSYCDRTFSKRIKVVTHERTHTGEKPYKCKVCGRAFSQTSILKTHMTLHTGKTFPCSKCDKKFSRTSFLKVHMRVHDNIRPYSCHLCEKNYRIKTHLDKHLSTHSNECNFPCEFCGKSFKVKSYLRSHLSNHTKPYKCPKCPLEAAQMYSFRIHLVNKHGIHDDPKLFKKSPVGSDEA